MESESVNFDELLVKALADFEKAQSNPDAPARKAEYKEYAAYLQGMSDDDDELVKSETEADSDMTRTGLATGEKKMANGMSREELHALRHEAIKRKEIQKVEITRTAFDQKVLPLSEEIPVEHKRLLVKLLTEPLRNLLEKYDGYVNRRITKLLLPAIPKEVRLAAAKWPWMFIPNPGFAYQTSGKYGEPQTYWVYPKVPYYFKPGTEQEVLRERDAELIPYFLDSIDKAISKWYATRDKLNEKEVMIATRLLKMGGNTYYHLLKRDPFWFDKLYNHIKQQQENERHSSSTSGTNLHDVRPDAQKG